MSENAKKPRIRFKGFTDAWEQREFGYYFFERNERSGNGEMISVTINSGIRKFSELNRHDTKPDDLSKYKKVEVGDIAYNSMRMWQGASGYSPYSGILSPAYTVISPKNGVSSRFFSYVLKQPRMIHLFEINSQGLTKDTWNLKYPAFAPIETVAPKTYEEQEKISGVLVKIDGLITFHQRKYDKLVDVKKSLLEKMFPQGDENTPKIRFKGFTETWEQRKFGEIVLIERGGSPRPIDDYITNDVDGLNWVKIGDAPEQGNYITKTAEKIKPSGLSKTREVHPNDLILSNSMSFGKPYIMAINGCIHDGWLLIRDTQEVFDLKFLCHLLGTTQMLSQYKAMAAGSTVNNLNKELVSNTNVMYPRKEEQSVVGKYFEMIDSLITLHQRKLEKLKNVKSALLEKMFV